MSSRLYALTRVREGDYVVPSNDGATLWRVTAYDEDGSAATWDGRRIAGRFWQVARHVGRLPADGAVPDDFLEWHLWEVSDSGLRTRREALAVAFPEASS